MGSENYLGEEEPMRVLHITWLRRTVFSPAGRAISDDEWCGGVALVAGAEDALGPACVLVVVVELCVAAFACVGERCGVETTGRSSRCGVRWAMFSQDHFDEVSACVYSS